MVLDLLLVMAAGAVLIAGIVVGRASLLSALAVYSYLASVRFVLRPAFILLGFDDFARPELVNGFPRESAWTAVLVFIVGHIALISGYLFYARSPIKASGLWQRRLSDHVSLSRAYWVAAALIGLNMVFWLDFLRTAGSIANLVRLSRLEFFDENSFVKSFPQWLIFFGVYIYLVSFRAPANRINLRRLGMACSLLGTLIMATYGDRSSIVMPLMIGMVAYHLAVKRVRFTTLAMLAAAGIAALGALGVMRSQLVSGADQISVGASVKQTGVAHYITEGLNLDVFDTFVVVIDRFEEIDYRLGEDFALGV
ncbi:MAG TPA: hypothetical protein VLI06_19100, partial [Solimonas sp.]|nr:hypothetical protein [Solimonas sp.]